MGETMRRVRRFGVRTGLAVLWLAGMAPLHASRLDPVTWSLQAQQMEATPGSTVILRLHAQIAGGYHLYSFTTPVGGPIKTRASLEFSSDVKAIQIYQPAPDHHEDPNLHVPVETFHGGVEFLLRTTLADSARTGAKFVTASVRYQACSDQICLAPVTKVSTVSFTVQPGAATVKVSIAAGYQLVDDSAGHASER
jgi:hypothetical protein